MVGHCSHPAPSSVGAPASGNSYPFSEHRHSNGYFLGSYRIATAPEPNSRRLTSLKSTCFDSPANNVGPWPASRGWTTNSYSSINPSSVNACASFTPPTSSPLLHDLFSLNLPGLFLLDSLGEMLLSS